MNTSDMRIDFTSVEEIITNLNKGIEELNEVFEKQSKNYEMLNSTDIWYGNAQLACSGKYEELKGQYESIINSLRQYSDFLKETNESMKDFEQSVDRSIDETFGGETTVPSEDGDHEEEVLV